eukprot:jgi/Tetstr1/429389/TSEL_019303.t1
MARCGTCPATPPLNDADGFYVPAGVLLVAALLISASPLGAFAGRSGPHGPKGDFAGKSAGRCGAFTGSDAVEASKHPLSESDGLHVVVCEKHLREHSTKLINTKVRGTNVEYWRFASRDDLPASSANAGFSESSKSSSDSQSSSFVSSSSQSGTPALGFTGIVAPGARRHLLEVTADTLQRVEAYITWVRTVLGGLPRNLLTASGITVGPDQQLPAGQLIFDIVIILPDGSDVQFSQARLSEDLETPTSTVLDTDPRANSCSNPRANPRAHPITNSCTNPRAHPCSNPRANSCPNSCSNPRAHPCTNSCSNPCAL